MKVISLYVRDRIKDKIIMIKNLNSEVEAFNNIIDIMRTYFNYVYEDNDENFGFMKKKFKDEGEVFSFCDRKYVMMVKVIETKEIGEI